jgi:hypothetical protein
MTDRTELTRLEAVLDGVADRVLPRVPADVQEFLAFGIKQAWACLFGALMLTAIIGTSLLYPDDAPLARNDLLVILAVLIQAGMLLARLETGRELIVIIVFHIVGTGMEIFKTAVGSWDYAAGGVAPHRCRAPVHGFHVRRGRLLPRPRASPVRPELHALPAEVADGGHRRRHLRQLLHPPFRPRPAPRRSWPPPCIVFVRCRMHFRVHRRTLSHARAASPSSSWPSSSGWRRTSARPPGPGCIRARTTGGTRCR